MGSRDVLVRLSTAGLLLAAIAYGLSDSFASIHRNWSDSYGPFAHGYLVLGMALWLAWAHWRANPPRRFGTWWMPFPLLVAGVLALWALEIMFFNSARQVLVPVIVWSAFSVLMGREVARVLFWPTAFVYFAMPHWWVLNSVLQTLTINVTNALVRITGSPAFVDANRFYLPAGIVEVADGCAGLNYLIVAMALASFQSLLRIPSWRSSLKLLALAAAVGLISNWLRVYLLIVVAYATDMQHYLIRVDHLYFGWVVFLVCIWPMIVYGARLERNEAGRGYAPSPSLIETRLPGSTVSPVVALACALVICVPTVFERMAVPAPTIDIGSTLEVPQGIEVTSGTRQLSWQTRSQHLSGAPLEILPGGNAIDWQRQSVASSWAEWRGNTASVGLLARVGYVVAGTPVSTRGAQFRRLLLRGALRGRRDAMVWAVMTPCLPDCDQARRRIGDAMAQPGAGGGKEQSEVL